jgi:calreticulin
MRLSLALVLVLCSAALANAYFKETFDGDWESRWKHSSDSGKGKFKVSEGIYKGDNGLQTTQDAKFYAISAPLDTEFSNEGKDLVLSFSVTHEQNIDCGGGYIKLLPKTDAASFNGDSQYYIMFGPDICGATKKIHLIFNYKGQNLLWKKEPRCEGDVLTHFYTLVLHPDNSYEVLVDNVKKESGKLDQDWDYLKPKTIPDPADKKPSDWVDEAEIADPEDKKPEDWDHEPETIADPDAAKPEDWDEEEDGAWEAPNIPNPKYKGEWRPKMIPNPKYKGVWKAKDIPNPEYEEDANLYLYKDIATTGFDLWQVKSGTLFDNIIVSNNAADATESFNAYKPLLEKEKKKKDDEEEKSRKEEESKRAAEPERHEEEEEEEEEEKDEL